MCIYVMIIYALWWRTHLEYGDVSEVFAIIMRIHNFKLLVIWSIDEIIIWYIEFIQKEFRKQFTWYFNFDEHDNMEVCTLFGIFDSKLFLTFKDTICRVSDIDFNQGSFFRSSYVSDIINYYEYETNRHKSENFLRFY